MQLTAQCYLLETMICCNVPTLVCLLAGQRAVFLTVCGEGVAEDPASSSTQDHSATLCYAIPTTCRGVCNSLQCLDKAEQLLWCRQQCIRCLNRLCGCECVGVYMLCCHPFSPPMLHRVYCCRWLPRGGVVPSLPLPAAAAVADVPQAGTGAPHHQAGSCSTGPVSVVDTPYMGRSKYSNLCNDNHVVVDVVSS